MDGKRKKFSHSQKGSIDSSYSSEEKSSSSSTETAKPAAKKLASDTLQFVQDVAEQITSQIPQVQFEEANPELVSELHEVRDEAQRRVNAATGNLFDAIRNVYLPSMTHFATNCRGAQQTNNILQVIYERFKRLCRNGIMNVEWREVKAEYNEARATFIGVIREPENELLEAMLYLWFDTYLEVRKNLGAVQLLKEKVTTARRIQSIQAGQTLRNFCWLFGQSMGYELFKRAAEIVEILLEWFRSERPSQHAETPEGETEERGSGDESKESDSEKPKSSSI